MNIIQGLSRFPTLQQWGECLLLLAAFGFSVKVIMPELIAPTTQPALKELLVVGAIAFLIPAFCEEIFFRGLLIPDFKPVWFVLSTSLFIAWHPLEAYLFLPKAIDLFTNPKFLILVGLLGVLCSFAYWRTKSLWASVFIHWIVVVVWKSLGGGGFIF